MSYKLTDNTASVLSALKSAKANGLEAVGMRAETHAKHKCPVDTGRLRNSITHVVDAEAAYVGTNVEYAPYVELGTSRMRARPFLKPAATDPLWDQQLQPPELPLHPRLYYRWPFRPWKIR